jgi:hypothetical protein
MLTHISFHKLPREEQYNYIWGKCLYLASREEQALKINLYHSGTFFIEVEYHIHNGRVRLIRTFHTSERLAKYVSGIDVQGLLMGQQSVQWPLPLLRKLPNWFWGGIAIKALTTLAICHFWLKLF